jgi:phage I-like protein
MITSLAAAIEMVATDNTPPKRVRLLPIGEFAPRGHNLKLRVESQQHAQEIVTASLAWAGAQDIPFDYDHQIEFAAVKGVGGRAPASGWGKSLTVEPDGVWANVEWTANAASAILAKEYKYLSPVVGHTADGKVLLITCASLTNMPAIDDLFKLAATRHINPKKDSQMDLTALAALLGLAATATIDEIHAALSAQSVAHKVTQDELTALRAALGAQDQTTALSAVNTLKASGGTDTATVALMTDMQAQLATLTAERNERYVNDAIAAGKITPAQKAHYVALMATNEPLAKQIIGAAPTVVNTGTVLNGEPQKQAVTALSAEQATVATMMGIDPAEFLKALNQESAA